MALNYYPNVFISATSWITAAVNIQIHFLIEVFNFKTCLQSTNYTIIQLQKKHPYYVSETVKYNCCTYFFLFGMLKMSGKCPLLTSLKQTKPLPWNHSLCRNFISSSITLYSLIWELRISGVLCSTLIGDTLLYKVYHYYCTVCVSSLQSIFFFPKKNSLYQDLIFSVNDKGGGGSRGLFHRTVVISFSMVL